MKLGQQIPRKAKQNGKGSVKSSKSKQHKAFLTVKPKEWDDINNKKLKGSQSFDNHVFVLKAKGNRRSQKVYHLANQHPTHSY